MPDQLHSVDLGRKEVVAEQADDSTCHKKYNQESRYRNHTLYLRSLLKIGAARRSTADSSKGWPRSVSNFGRHFAFWSWVNQALPIAIGGSTRCAANARVR